MISARDFWSPILSDPEVERLCLSGLGSMEDFLSWLDGPDVHEERYTGGGLIFVDKGLFQEVHVAFLPEQWGRPVALAFRDCFAWKMNEGRAIIAGEQEGEWRTKPPISHGWKVLTDFEDSVLPRRVRYWILTRDAWTRSPVGRNTA